MVTIREARKEDIDQIKELNWKFLGFYIDNRLDTLMKRSPTARNWGRRFVDRTFSKTNWKYFVAEDNGKIVGFINGKIDSYPPIYEERKFGFLWVIYVENSYRRKGIAKKLLDAFIGWLKESGVKVVEATAAPENIVSWALLEPSGFKSLETRYRLKL